LEDQFFAKLREIQRKERANSSLARIGNDFYKRTHRYLDNIRDIAVNDPFSEESDLLRNAQRIATEICEIREHKIANAAVINIHRSYHLFQGKPQFDLIDTTPLNITEEEEKLYFSFIDVLKEHRKSISLDELTTNKDNSINPNNLSDDISSDNNSIKTKSSSIAPNTSTESNNIKSDNIKLDNVKSDNIKLDNVKSDNIKSDNIKSDNNKLINDKLKNENNAIEEDNVLKRLKNIKSAKIIENERIESIEEQISNSNDFNGVNKDYKSSKSTKSVNFSESTKSKDFKGFNKNILEHNNKNIKKGQKNELINIIGNEDDQFVDLDSLADDESFSSYNTLNLDKSKSTTDKIANVMILIFSEINSIIGVDKKIYGPFRPQDVVIMPDINAKILIKNKKCRLIKI